VDESRNQSSDPHGAVTPAELRVPDLPLQHFGGYSKEATDDLLRRAAAALERAGRGPGEAPNERTVGEALVTAHRAAETVVTEARAKAQTIVHEAERRADELRGEQAEVQDMLARARDEAQVAQREIADLHNEARRVRSVIDEFRSQWSNLVSGALEQLERRISGADQSVDAAASLERDLHDRLVEPQTEAPRPPWTR
jgi:cell division septum initiation protein DivIVA